jgi:glyoxylase-like metal-dependent hydrolase (beta-lactamase superfamily II)
MREVFFLSSGTFVSPALAVGSSRRVLPSKKTTLSNTVAVAVRDSGDVVLVDVGWSAEACADPAGVLGKLRTTSLGMRARRDDAIALQLEALGIERARVKTIVATHLHLDHVGGACDFPNAEVVCTDRELRAFRGLPRDLGYRADDLARAGRTRTVLLDGAPTYGFPGSFDLFGDGEIVLCDARGHTPGLAAVALRSKSACFMHVGDAVYQTWEYGLAPPGPSLIARVTGWRREEMARAYASIRACEADPRRPTIVPSHDMTVFEKLPHAPAEN